MYVVVPVSFYSAFVMTLLFLLELLRLRLFARLFPFILLSTNRIDSFPMDAPLLLSLAVFSCRVLFFKALW